MKTGDPAGQVETLLGIMDQTGVKRAAVITPTTVGFDNSLTFEIAHSYPDRIVPIARINPQADDVAKQARELFASGARGLRISINDLAQGGPIEDSNLDPLWHLLSETRVPLALHCRYDQLSFVLALSQRYPELVILLDHMARMTEKIAKESDAFDRLIELSGMNEIHVKVSSTNFFSTDPVHHLDLAPLVERLLEAFGSKRLLWGSDWPLALQKAEYELSFEPFLQLGKSMSEGVLEDILATNFERIYALHS